MKRLLATLAIALGLVFGSFAVSAEPALAKSTCAHAFSNSGIHAISELKGHATQAYWSSGGYRMVDVWFYTRASLNSSWRYSYHRLYNCGLYA